MFQITSDDIQRLSNNPSPEVRASIAKKIARDHEQMEYSEQERILAEKILRVLAHDAEVMVRSRLAWEIRNSGAIPRDIALDLANDVEQVSLSLLKFSPLLTPEDLIEIIAEGNTEKNMVVASRRGLPDRVSAALAETRDKLVVRVLLENESAELSSETMEILEEYFGGDTRLRQLLTDRRALQESVSRHFIRRITHEVKSKLFGSREEDFGEYERILWNDDEQIADNLLQDRNGDLDYAGLVEMLAQKGELDSGFVMMALDFSRKELFELAASRLLGIDRDELTNVLKNGGNYGRERLFERIGLQEENYENYRRNLEELYGPSGEKH
ncbi:DUF2336 domain-containing protein [Aestuariispira insulae]|uniref:Uncharacterized protein (DUF2336 family) n=1 Tax=Aestuariispira insulae TaxID=1461337 RepID=A0A3D9HK81_9PROT|nr:DUF2336 domain-containing protein [Aestuariispira insulae]RED49888.1 uncharacterized protein (DUF2336 family) [Aestuariispira insulae]